MSSRLSNFELVNGEVNIWWIHWAHFDDWVREFAQILSCDEKTRSERFRLERHKRRFICVRGILRILLGVYLEMEPREILVLPGPRGKPYVSTSNGKEKVNFNLSYSREIALYAFCRDFELGVDVERITKFPEMDQIIENSFSVEERDSFSALRGRERRNLFYKCWTRKEALLKAIGEGLFVPTERLNVLRTIYEFGPSARVPSHQRRHCKAFIRDLQLDPAFASACAVIAPGLHPVLDRPDCLDERQSLRLKIFCAGRSHGNGLLAFEEMDTGNQVFLLQSAANQ